MKDNERVQQLIDDKRDPDDLRGNLLKKFTVKDNSHYAANDRRWEWREWCTTRWGPLKAHIDMYMTREEFIHRAYVVQHQDKAYDNDPQSAMHRRTPHTKP